MGKHMLTYIKARFLGSHEPTTFDMILNPNLPIDPGDVFEDRNGRKVVFIKDYKTTWLRLLLRKWGYKTKLYLSKVKYYDGDNNGVSG